MTPRYIFITIKVNSKNIMRKFRAGQEITMYTFRSCLNWVKYWRIEMEVKNLGEIFYTLLILFDFVTVFDAYHANVLQCWKEISFSIK